MCKKTILSSFLLCFVVGLSACSSTKMRDVWQDEKFSRDNIKNILVVGFTSNVTNRMVFEREFVYQLDKKHGIDAKASYKVIGKHMPVKEELIAYLKDNEYEYVMVSYVGSQEVDKTFIKPTVTNYVTGGYPYGGYGHGYGYSSFGGYWGGGSVTTVQTPGYFDETTKTILITSIYDTKTLDIKWTGRSSTFEAQSVSRVTEEVAKVVWDHIQ